ncbi:MAG: tRNA lysidine(34) synthetase TilS, partial [Sphingopyxis sp.]
MEPLAAEPRGAPPPLPDAAGLRATIAQIIGPQCAAQDRFGIAVSGGPDSLALLLLAAQAFPHRTWAATVDHQLRADSAGEAAMVAQLCADRAIPHAILHPDQPITGSIQAQARAARYAALERWRQENGIGWLLTAHHADDQLETIIMRLNRASGVNGMSAIRARNGVILRPLLAVRRQSLAAFLAVNQVVAVDDPSNRNHILTGFGCVTPWPIRRLSVRLPPHNRPAGWQMPPPRWIGQPRRWR